MNKMKIRVNYKHIPFKKKTPFFTNMQITEIGNDISEEGQEDDRCMSSEWTNTTVYALSDILPPGRTTVAQDVSDGSSITTGYRAGPGVCEAWNESASVSAARALRNTCRRLQLVWISLCDERCTEQEDGISPLLHLYIRLPI